MPETPPRRADDGDRLVADNRKARHEYEIPETYEAGMVLTWQRGQVSAGGAREPEGQLRAHRARRGVSAERAHQSVRRRQPLGHEPERERKLLLHRSEIDKLTGRVQERGLTPVPLKVYFKNGRAKVLLGSVAERRSTTSENRSRSARCSAKPIVRCAWR
jgi:SsrA-binding protein